MSSNGIEIGKVNDEDNINVPSSSPTCYTQAAEAGAASEENSQPASIEDNTELKRKALPSQSKKTTTKTTPNDIEDNPDDKTKNLNDLQQKNESSAPHSSILYRVLTMLQQFFNSILLLGAIFCVVGLYIFYLNTNHEYEFRRISDEKDQRNKYLQAELESLNKKLEECRSRTSLQDIWSEGSSSMVATTDSQLAENLNIMVGKETKKAKDQADENCDLRLNEREAIAQLDCHRTVTKADKDKDAACKAKIAKIKMEKDAECGKEVDQAKQLAYFETARACEASCRTSKDQVLKDRSCQYVSFLNFILDIENDVFNMENRKWSVDHDVIKKLDDSRERLRMTIAAHDMLCE